MQFSCLALLGSSLMMLAEVRGMLDEFEDAYFGS